MPRGSRGGLKHRSSTEEPSLPAIREAFRRVTGSDADGTKIRTSCRYPYSIGLPRRCACEGFHLGACAVLNRVQRLADSIMLKHLIPMAPGSCTNARSQRAPLRVHLWGGVLGVLGVFGVVGVFVGCFLFVWGGEWVFRLFLCDVGGISGAGWGRSASLYQQHNQ